MIVQRKKEKVKHLNQSNFILSAAVRLRVSTIFQSDRIQ